MPRPARIQVPGGVYHVTARGVDHVAVYRDEMDYVLFVALLAKAIARFGWISHMYCLMTTHFHLIVETPQPNIARGMQWLNGTYAQAFNDRHGRVGHLFGGRYGAVLFQSEKHYETALRYVAYNPVGAGLCRHPCDWVWTGIAPGRRLSRSDVDGV
jgi:putative transposase